MASSVGAVVALGLLLATSAFAQVAQQNDVNAYTCPVGFVPYQRALVGGGPGGQLVGNVTCIEDPCYKDVCGPGKPSFSSSSLSCF